MLSNGGKIFQIIFFTSCHNSLELLSEIAPAIACFFPLFAGAFYITDSIIIFSSRAPHNISDYALP